MKTSQSGFPSEEVKARWADLMLTQDRIIEQNQSRFKRRLRCHRINEIKSYGLEWSRSAILLALSLLFAASAFICCFEAFRTPILNQSGTLTIKDLRPIPQDIFEFDKSLKADVEAFEKELANFNNTNISGGIDQSIAAKEEKLKNRALNARSAFEKAVNATKLENEKIAADNSIVEESSRANLIAKQQRQNFITYTQISTAIALILGLFFYLSQRLHVEIEFPHGKIRRSLSGTNVNLPQIIQFFESLQKVLNDNRNDPNRTSAQDQKASDSPGYIAA